MDILVPLEQSESMLMPFNQRPTTCKHIVFSYKALLINYSTLLFLYLHLIVNC